MSVFDDFYDDDYDEYDPCVSCGQDCDEWEAQFCFIRCRSIYDYDPMDI